MSDLLDLRTVNETLALGPCAEVRVGERVIRYVRRGSGPCVVLLDPDADANPVWKPLADSLASGFRLVVPQPPVDDVDTNAWLRGFVEGLGLSECVLVAGPALASAALDLAALDDLTVRRLVVITTGEPPAAPLSSRVLWVDRDEPAAESVRRVRAFIVQGGPDSES